MRIAVIATGGTIATGASGLPERDARALLAGVPLPDGLHVAARDLGPRPSASFDAPFLEELRAAIEEAMERSDGVVVVQGTDSLEETAYLFDRWRSWPRPLVFTGAMRNAALPSPDGAANLGAAILAAAAGLTDGADVLVAMGDELHLATYVQKGWSQRVHAFHSPEAGPFATFAEGRHVKLWQPLPHRHWPAPRLTARVGLVRTFLGMGPADVPEGPYDALVVEGMGAGHVPAAILPRLDEMVARGIPVVVTPRTAAGLAARDTYAFPGAERDLAARGVLMGTGPGLKARIRLWLALSAEPRLARQALAEVAAAF